LDTCDIAICDPMLKRLTKGQSDSSILLASLGAMLPGTYLAADAPVYGALMGLALAWQPQSKCSNLSTSSTNAEAASIRVFSSTVLSLKGWAGKPVCHTTRE